MNYFDLLPDEIVDYIYKINNKNLIKEVHQELNDRYNNYCDIYGVDDLDDLYEFKGIFITFNDENKFYPNYDTWCECIGDFNIDITFLWNAYYDCKKIDIMRFSEQHKYKIRKSWTKKKMIKYLFDNGLLPEFLQVEF